jgi:predicted nucleic acid-binding protein
MMYVLDSCVGLKWIFLEADSEIARKLRDDFTNGVIELLVPDIFPVEVAHAITRAERANRISAAEGERNMTIGTQHNRYSENFRRRKSGLLNYL